MPGPLTIRPGIVVPQRELQWRFSRSSGPGGQSVNTTDSRVELSFDIERSTALSPFLRERALERLSHRLVNGVLTVVAAEERSQLRNREAAEERLARLLRSAIAAPPPRRRATKPTKNSVRRRIEAKRRRGELKRRRSSPPPES
ncbi:MAG: alternative ribosome rescue aminoacyl-tRNA hydrolase ArfB [Nocardioidaceae bacterium]